jgi:hypothetical protein
LKKLTRNWPKLSSISKQISFLGIITKSLSCNGIVIWWLFAFIKNYGKYLETN